MSKKIIGVGASAVLAMVLLIEQSAAACFETAEKFKLEGGDKAKNIQTIMDYGNCIKNEYAEKRASLPAESEIAEFPIAVAFWDSGSWLPIHEISRSGASE